MIKAGRTVVCFLASCSSIIQALQTANLRRKHCWQIPRAAVYTHEFDVVLTHTTADFDSLASAVGLAKLWQKESRNTTSFVILPRGAHPVVAEYLALHRHVFPIKDLKDVAQEIATGRGLIRRIGMVDCQRRDRIGPGTVLLDHVIENHGEVTVIDHHIDKESDVNATTLVVEHVGSVSTIVAEMCRKANVHLTDAEATLLALGLHAGI